jgi:hypothetical protein
MTVQSRTFAGYLMTEGEAERKGSSVRELSTFSAKYLANEPASIMIKINRLEWNRGKLYLEALNSAVSVKS